MADLDIAGLTQAQADYVDETDELIIQKAGQTSVKKIQINDLFGGWRNLIPYESINGTAGGAPILTPFPVGAAEISDWAFAINDERWLKYHFNHDIKQSATMYPSVDTITSGTDVNIVRWQIYWVLANGHGAGQFGVSATFNIDCTPTGVAMTHYTDDYATGLPTPLPDTTLLMRIRRITNGGTDNADTVWLNAENIKIPVQMFATKNRNPDFYV